MVDSHGPIKTGRFEVEIDDAVVASWKTVTIPSVSVEEGTYRKSDKSGKKKNKKKKTWGQVSFDDLEMERGVKPGDTKLHDWFEDVRAGNVDKARKEIAVKIQNEEGDTCVSWEFDGAWIKEYDPPDLDATADGDVATESITVAYDRMMRKDPCEESRQ